MLWDQFNFDLTKSYKKIINLSNDAFIFSPDVWEGGREACQFKRKKMGIIPGMIISGKPSFLATTVVLSTR